MSDPIFKRIFNMIYPIGSIYMSTNSTSPATLFGGTWEQIKGRFLVGQGQNDANSVNTYRNMCGQYSKFCCRRKIRWNKTQTLYKWTYINNK